MESKKGPDARGKGALERLEKGEASSGCISISAKGLALLCAIDAGLCPEIEDGYDIEAFEHFWAKYEADLAEYGKRYAYNAGKMLDQQPEDEGYRRYKYRCYRNLILKSLLAFGFGVFVSLLFKLQ